MTDRQLTDELTLRALRFAASISLSITPCEAGRMLRARLVLDVAVLMNRLPGDREEKLLQLRRALRAASAPEGFATDYLNVWGAFLDGMIVSELIARVRPLKANARWN